MVTANEDAQARIHSWFTDLLRTCGWKKGEVATLLNIKGPGISRLAAGTQSLRADQMLVLAEAFNRPLPTRTARATTFSRELFDKAFDQVRAMELAKPAAQRMSQEDTLETVFYVMHRMAEAND